MTNNLGASCSKIWAFKAVGAIMEIMVNGQPRQVAEDYTVADLIADMALQGRRLAVEINLEIIPRSLHQAQRFSAGDKVEIVHAIGGG